MRVHILFICTLIFARTPATTTQHSRYGGISVGGVNSQVRMTEPEIEAVIRDLKSLFNSPQVCYGYWDSGGLTASCGTA